ncbi:Protein CBG13791 [Caenorhabditis briggsae]|uniref:Protein CBG13791 n=1 Tax=Caenorhabditis briggsae TaxID=6238 RepID=A8XIP9_CAEBR|nr:Protein CBG13791 [Caenorhabditis briggsae]CAP32524.1 Protein CBG13791 [Caenorhabditis briggsae]
MDGGGVQGSVMFFDLHADQHTKEGEYITVRYYKVSDVGIRNTDFSPCGRFVVAVIEDSCIVRMDREMTTFSTSSQTTNHFQFQQCYGEREIGWYHQGIQKFCGIKKRKKSKKPTDIPIFQKRLWTPLMSVYYVREQLEIQQSKKIL